MRDQDSRTDSAYRLFGRFLGGSALLAMTAVLAHAEHIPVNNGSFGGMGIADVEYIDVIQNSQTDPITCQVTQVRMANRY